MSRLAEGTLCYLDSLTSRHLHFRVYQARRGWICALRGNWSAGPELTAWMENSGYECHLLESHSWELRPVPK